MGQTVASDPRRRRPAVGDGAGESVSLRRVVIAVVLRRGRAGGRDRGGPLGGAAARRRRAIWYTKTAYPLEHVDAIRDGARALRPRPGAAWPRSSTPRASSTSTRVSVAGRRRASCRSCRRRRTQIADESGRRDVHGGRPRGPARQRPLRLLLPAPRSGRLRRRRPRRRRLVQRRHGRGGRVARQPRRQQGTRCVSATSRIPETRAYVKKVLEARRVYRETYGDRLSCRRSAAGPRRADPCEHVFVLVESRTHDRVHDPGRTTTSPATSRRPSTPLSEGVDRGDRYQTLLGVTGSGKTFTMANVIAEGAEADAGHRPQQDAGRPALQRVPRVPSRQRGRVLRQLLRLLPARGLRRGAGPLHREGLVHQRRDRPPAPRGHHVALPAPRRGHRRQRQLHLRLGLAGGVPARRWCCCRSARPSSATRCCAGSSTSSTRATTSSPRAASSACAATPSRSGPPRRTPPSACSSGATRWSRSSAIDPVGGEVHREAGPRRHLPGDALRHQRPGHRALARRDPPRDGGALRLVRGERQDPRGPPPAAAHPVRHGDAARDGLLQRHRELLAHPAGQGAGRHAQLPARLLPGRLPLLRRRVAHDAAADPRHVRGRQVAQAAAGGLRLPPAERARQPAAALRRVPREGAAARLRERHPGPVRAGQQRQHRRADHPPHGPHRPRGRGAAHRRGRSTTS